MSVKINSIQLENIKRVKAVQLEPSEAGLTIIGGNNRQGKTSVLDAIVWALGGNRYKPSEPHREGSVLDPSIKLVLSNGLRVERSGKNGALKVTDPNGNKAGQQLLDGFIAELALDLPKFMAASNKDKAETLLNIIGVGPQLHTLDRKEQELYNKRHSIGQIADQKKKWAAEQPYYEDAPETLISAGELIKQQQEILLRNQKNKELRDEKAALENQVQRLQQQTSAIAQQIADLQEKHRTLLIETEEILIKLDTATKTVEELQDESTAELEASIQNVDAINIKVRANLDKVRAEEEAEQYQTQYSALTEEIESVRKDRMALLDGANLPLSGLSIQDGELTYKGYKWDAMSGADQLIVATAIVRQLTPDCGFVLMDKLEQMDRLTLEKFGEWLEQESLQVIATRVSTGEECTIIIEDGYILEQQRPAAHAGMQPAQTAWKAGEF
ncbi:AAA family ATPase [Peptococcus niger]|uniref:AAA domain-containing protein n=1 Tax=Peptococcus niger TaxID=2741 RepID=A0A1G6RLP3_PEPNI|nr:ATP-binding protein [Peptococcus niger]SDD05488.1 AAA domain-containing protein [Peptococcus niger]